MRKETVILEGFYTTRDMLEIFNVTKQAIYNWRNLDHDPLPVVIVSGSPLFRDHALRFDPKEVIPWAKRNNKKIVKPR